MTKVKYDKILGKVREEGFDPKGTYEDLIAGDLTSMNDRVTVADKFVIRPTAGDESIESGTDALLLELVGGCGTTEDKAFKINALRWNEFNQLNPNNYIDCTLIGYVDSVIPGGFEEHFIINPPASSGAPVTRLYIIRCPRCEIGNYGTAEKNNGYLFTDREGNNMLATANGSRGLKKVLYCRNYPAVGTTLDHVYRHRFDGHDEYFYIPDEGYMLVELADGIDPADVCAHIAWSKDYNTFKEYTEPAELVVAVPPLTTAFDTETINEKTCLVLRGIEQGNRIVSDRVVIYAEGGGSYERNIKSQLLTGLTWTETEISGEVVEGEGSAVNGYRYTASLPSSGTYAALRDGLVRSDIDGITLDGYTLTYDSATQINPASLFANKYVDYQIASPVTGTHTIDPTGKPADDMGTEEVVGGNSPTGTIVISYMRGFKDTMRALVNSFKNLKAQFDESEYTKPRYCMGAWLENANTATPLDLDNPDALAVIGDKDWALDWRPFLIDMTAIEGETKKRPVMELKKNNWLRDIHGNWAPVVGITTEMRNECMANNLFTDVECTEKYCDAGAYDPEAFLALCSIETFEDQGEVVKRLVHPTLYKDKDMEVTHYLMPWETTETKYSIFVGRKDEVYLLDNVIGASGKEWNGIMAANANVWDGVDVKAFALKPTGISPSAPTTIVDGGVNKLRSFFFNYVASDSYSHGTTGASGCTLFQDNGHYRTRSISQIGTKTRARANNHVATNPFPVAEGGFHARNTFLRSLETAWGTKNLCDATRFSGGIMAATCNNESTWKSNGGLRYRESGSNSWSYCRFDANPAIYYGKAETKTTTNASNWLSGYGPMSKTMEAQIAVSFAAEFGIDENEPFMFNGSKWCYVNPTTNGLFNPKTVADGVMNCRVYKIVTGSFTGYASASATETTEFEIEVCLRTGLMLGCDMSGDGGPYWGGGCEVVGECLTTPASNSFGFTLDAYIEPDQTQWTNESDASINIGQKFAFEEKYKYAGSIVTRANAYTRRRLPNTPLPASNGGGYTSGECAYCYMGNYWGAAGKRTRVGLRFGHSAYSSVLSARYLYASYSAGATNTYFCSSAQVLLDVQ